MKKFFTALMLVATAMTSFAEFNGSGFYRVENATSHRFATMQDNKGSINIQTSSADVAAVQLIMGFENVIADPSSVLYLEKISGSGNTYQLDIQAQGVSMYAMLANYLQLRDNGDGTYYAYGSSAGMTLYLCDPEKSDCPDSPLGTQSQGYRKWLINPIDNSAEAGFGAQAEVTVGGEHFAPFFAGFPFSTYSDGMSVYYINKVDAKYGIAVMAEATGVIPASTPVFIKCNSTDPTTNLLTVGGTATASIANNQLCGVYFDNDANSKHFNRTPYDKNTMRIFGVTSEGKLGFVTEAEREYLPRNRAYLSVPSGSPAEFTVMTAAEYEEFLANLPVDPEGINIVNVSERVAMGSTLALNLEVEPANASVEGLVWSSSDESVATVDNNGVVTGVGVGECHITATLGQFTDRCKVLVFGETPVIILSESELTLTEGDVVTVEAMLYADYGYEITWASSDPEVATVEDGTITAIQVGTVYITASCGDTVETIKVVVNDITGIASVVADQDGLFNVYNLQGVCLQRNLRSLDGLQKGLYIINGTKVLIK